MDTLIHIGYPKNASTWFQSEFFPNIDNVDYITMPIIREQFLNPNSFNFNPEKVQSYFKNNYNKRLLLSHQNLIGSINSGGFNGMATKEFGNRLKSVFPDAHIILFLRNQAELISSAYLQTVIEGSTFSIDSYIHHKNRNLSNNMMMFSFPYLEYDKLIKYYYELFGKEKVHVFLYEDFNNDKISFLRNFSSIFNLNIDVEKLNFNKINYKIRKYLIPIAKTFYIFTKKNTIFKYYILNIPYWFPITRTMLKHLNKYKIFGRSPSSISILGKKNYDIINNYYRSSNNILYKELGITNIEKYNYPL